MQFMFLMILMVATPPEQAGRDSLAAASDLDLLLRLEMEVSGLLDSYLEAVPECPVRRDTPLRPWLLGLAWLRSEETIAAARRIGADEGLMPAELSKRWGHLMTLTESYHEMYGSICTYYGSGNPDSSTSLELENELLERDSLWHYEFEILLEAIAAHYERSE